VVNLPDILFDVNQDTLKPEAQIVLAKLVGILLIMPDQDALVEGHTDATGDDRYNLDLSRRRARSVTRFLQLQGLEPQRLEAVGYGIERPVADNETAAGRKRNRRVEIVISRADGTLEP
jgi:outer membrane protein OmpA-like peptidoglycan-associated protein